MKEYATISSKGQVVIPKTIRDFYTLKARTKIIFELLGDNIIIKPQIKNYPKKLKNKLANFTIDPNFRKNWEKALARRTKGW